MQAHNSLADAATGYFLAFYAMLGQHGSEIMGFLGFLLLVAKLAQEVPKALALIQGKKNV